MKKLDLRKEFKHLYSPSAKQPEIIKIPKINYLMIDGVGDPNTAKEYQDAIAALYGVAYGLKFMTKKGKEAIDYPVMMLEGLWWAEGADTMALTDLMKRKDIWQWTMMIMQPKFITRRLFTEAVNQVAKKKNLPVLAKLRLEPFEEGQCAQIMHVGPYTAEGPTIERLHEFIAESEHTLRGRHHEIYLSDPRKAKPEKMRTVLRQPIK
jgi:hypothetical protein